MKFLLFFVSMLSLMIGSITIQGQTVTFTTAGNATWLCPAGITSITVECWGGGGGGGGGAPNTAASGGAGGSYSQFIMTVTPGTTYNLRVGATGTAGTNTGGTGGTGGSSYFGNTVAGAPAGATTLAVGGVGGNGSTAGSGTALGSTTGNIGNALYFYAGGNGAANVGTGSSGGGGGGAGNAAPGGNAAGITAGVGGVGGGGGGAAGSTSNGAGAAGTAPGGAGAGGNAGNNGRKGGAGARGQVIITYIPCSAPTSIVISVTPSSSCTIPQSVTFDVTSFTGGNLNGGTWQYQWQNGATILQAWNVTSSYTASLSTSVTYTVYMRSSACIATVSLGANAIYTLLTLPSLPSIITGSTTPCMSSNQTYSVTNTVGITYNWVFPVGWTIVSGQGTNSVIVNISNGASSGSVTVTPSNSCGNGTSQTLASAPVAAPIVSITPSPASICIGTGALLTASGAITYTWSPAAGLSGTSGTTVTANPAITSTYTISGTSGGCAGTNTFTVTVNPYPTVTSTASPTTICAGASSSLTANGATSYLWSSGLGTTATVSASPMSTITYTVVGSTANCTASSTVSVTVIPLVTPNFATIPAFCSGSTAPLLGPTSPNGINGSWNPATIDNTTSGTYIFTPNAGVCATTQSLNVTITPQTVPNFAAIPGFCIGSIPPLLSTTSLNGITGTWNPSIINNVSSAAYTFTPTVGQCAASTSLNSTIYPKPMLSTVASPASICSGSSSTLSASGANTYIWMPGSLQDSVVNVSPTTNTIYTVTGTSSVGCTGTTTVTVSLYTEVALQFTTSPAQGCYPLPVDFKYIYNALTDSNSLHWDFGDPTTIMDVSTLLATTYTYTNQGIFNVTLTGTTFDGCPALGHDVVKVLPPPQAAFYADPSITDTYQPLIHFYDESVNTYGWCWSFGDANSNYSIEEFPEHTYTDPGVYEVTLIAYNETCTDTLKQEIVINEGFAFYIPNSFAPSSTITSNTVFNGKGIGVRSDNFELYIYDRSGKKLFYTNDSNKGWNGKVDGKDKLCEGGVYVYKFRVKELNYIEHKYVGTVLLLR